MEGAICIGTNLDGEQTPLITIWWVWHASSGLNDLFWGPKHGKISLETHPFRILFRLPPLCVVFDSHGLHWAPWW